MRKRLQRPPSQRNLEIFYDHVCHSKTQAEVARQHHITQARVSQIVQRVSCYIATVQPLQSVTAEQQSYYFCHIYNEKLYHLQCLAEATFVEQHSWCQESHKSGEKRHPPRADTKLLTLCFELVQEQKRNCAELTSSGEKCKDSHRRAISRKQAEAKLLCPEATIPPKSFNNNELNTAQQSNNSSSAGPQPSQNSSSAEAAPQPLPPAPSTSAAPVKASTAATAGPASKGPGKGSPAGRPVYRFFDPKEPVRPKPPPKPRDPNVIIWHSVLRE